MAHWLYGKWARDSGRGKRWRWTLERAGSGRQETRASTIEVGKWYAEATGRYGEFQEGQVARPCRIARLDNPG